MTSGATGPAARRALIRARPVEHLLALSVVPVVVLFVLAEDRLRLLRRPRLLLELALLFAAGLSFYLFIVIRAFTGPPELYHDLRTLDGLIGFISGAQFRVDMRFGTRREPGPGLAGRA